jgi:hypothetical protein
MKTLLQPSSKNVPKPIFQKKRHTANRSIALLLSLLLWVSGCQQSNQTEPTPVSKATESLSADVAYKWADQALKLIRKTPGFTPPVAARALGYAGLTMYETVVPGSATNRTLLGQLNDFKSLPRTLSGQNYDWAIAANAGQAYILKNLFANTAAANKVTIDSLETALNLAYKTPDLSNETFDRSVKFGQDVAAAIFEWSKSDGGHEGYTRNFPANYQVPIYPGAWQPTENGQKIPLQPYWGRNRTFLIQNSILPAPEPLKFSTDITSPYFKQYFEVYQKNTTLTQEEKEIAVWWADDPSETFTPPGHSYNLAMIASKTAKANLMQASETFARVGIAVADAFINCWKCKYMFNNERPYTMVRRTIDPNWVPFWPAPPFPGFTSGHATQSAATATVLTAIYGENFAFTDDSHVGRIRDTKRKVDFKARSFVSFWKTAEESALSRFLGGIHTRQDNELGLAEGKSIGENINKLRFKK